MKSRELTASLFHPLMATPYSVRMRKSLLSDTVVQIQRIHCKQAWASVHCFLSLEGMNSTRLLKPLPTALEVLRRQRVPVTVKQVFGCPTETSKADRETSVIFNTDLQKLCVLGMSLLKLRVKREYTLFLPKKVSRGDAYWGSFLHSLPYNTTQNPEDPVSRSKGRQSSFTEEKD